MSVHPYPSTGRKHHAQVVPVHMLILGLLVFTEQPPGPSDLTFHRVERGVKVFSCLVARLTEEISLDV